MALFAQHPADGVDYVRFAASVRADDARRTRAAERYHGAAPTTGYTDWNPAVY